MDKFGYNIKMKSIMVNKNVLIWVINWLKSVKFDSNQVFAISSDQY